jgi:hypothetical protein
MVHMYCKCSANVLQHVYYADPADAFIRDVLQKTNYTRATLFDIEMRCHVKPA